MPQDFAKDIGIRVHKLACLMGRTAEQSLRTVGDLTFAQFRILMALLHGATLNQKKIAQYHGLTEAAVSRMLVTLQKHRLVRLTHDPKSKRTHRLTLTPLGKRTAEKTSRMLEMHFTKTFRLINASQKQSLLTTLDALINGLASEKI